jgi:hypothetical protein
MAYVLLISFYLVNMQDEDHTGQKTMEVHNLLVKITHIMTVLVNLYDIST